MGRSFLFSKTILTAIMVATFMIPVGTNEEIFAYSKVLPNHHDKKNFPMPREVEKQFLFWQQIFYRFPSTTTLVHDTREPGKIIDIIDHKLLAKTKGKSKVSSRRKREEVNNLYLKRYNLALTRFRRLGKKAIKYGPIEQRIYSVYSKGTNRLPQLYRGSVEIRTQTGLADEFIIAAGRAQDYLPYMERVFRMKGIPTRITRLAFVESMFNVNARSKVGASGIWQFMPATAKMYMNVNHIIDERNSPFIAAKGAASLLSDNYKSLKSWPLAITAYNHGRGGMSRAVRKTGSKNFGTILRRYRAKGFGFASRNFYAEYLAAAHVYDRLINEGKVKRKPSKLNLTAIKLRKRISMSQLLSSTPMTRSLVKKYNPSFKNRAFTTNKHTLLPKSLELFVPTKIAGKVQLGLSKIRKKKRYAHSKRVVKW